MRFVLEGDEIMDTFSKHLLLGMFTNAYLGERTRGKGGRHVGMLRPGQWSRAVKPKFMYFRIDPQVSISAVRRTNALKLNLHSKNNLFFLCLSKRLSSERLSN